MSEEQQFFISKVLVVNNFNNLEMVFADFLEKNKNNSKSRQQVRWLGNPDDSFGIGEVRNLQEQLSFSIPDYEEWWYLIRNGDDITLPAQHALLKMLEEPPRLTHICIVTSKPRLLLPTILSRCTTITLEETTEVSNPGQAINSEEIISKLEDSNLSDLIDLAGQFKEKNDALDFFLKLQDKYYSELKSNPKNEKLINKLNAIQKAINLLQINVNIRILIEHTLFQMI